MESNPPIEYNLLIESEQGQAVVELGQEQGWLEKYRYLLDTVTRLSLLPRNDGLPFVSVSLDGTKRWIYFSRVHSKMDTSRRIRLYAIGWQDTVNDRNVKCILWVYPNGSVECADEPHFVELFL